MNEKEFEKLVEKLGYEYEFFDKFWVDLKETGVSFAWDENTKSFRVYSSISLEDLLKNFEEVVGLEYEKWTPKIRKLWDKLVDKIVKEIGVWDVDVDLEYINFFADFKKFKPKQIKEKIKEFKEINERYEKKFTDWRVIYDYLTHEEIRSAILSKLTFMIPCEIKPIGGSYQVIIPVEGLRLIVDENVLKERKKIKAKLTIDPTNKEIKINSIE